MSRVINVAVSEEFLSLTVDYYQSSYARKNEVKVNFVRIPDPKDSNRKQLKELLLEAEVGLLHSNLFPVLPECMSDNMRWIQSTHGGMDLLQSIDVESRKKLDRCVFTRAVGVFGPAMSEYLIGWIVALERNFDVIRRWQSEKVWKPSKTIVESARPLSSLSIGILGLGSIGSYVAKVCKGFGMTVYGLKRTMSDVEHVDQVFLQHELSKLLEISDYVCNVMPSTPETKGLLSGEVLKSCAKRKSVFVNMGRGDVIDERSISNALDKEWISKAILDVFEKEPLDPSSLLWSKENVFITPHLCDAGHEPLMPKLFFSNFDKYLCGGKLSHVYDFEKGY